MSTLSVEQINNAVKLNTFTDSRFKTLGLSVDLLLPLEEATAAQRGNLPALATRATRRYPDYTALSCRLAELYGGLAARLGLDFLRAPERPGSLDFDGVHLTETGHRLLSEAVLPWLLSVRDGLRS